MTRDQELLESLRSFLGRGSLRVERHRNPRWAPATVLTLGSLAAHHVATIPFAETYLPRFSAKWRQYERWRDQLYRHEQARPSRFLKGRTECAAAGCELPVRGRGLCRRHYYRVTGH